LVCLNYPVPCLDTSVTIGHGIIHRQQPWQVLERIISNDASNTRLLLRLDGAGQ
jgi:hypothetical protein